MKVRCSLVVASERPFVVRRGSKIRWLLRMACGATFASPALEPPVSVLCSRSDDCAHAAPAPPRRVRLPLEW